MSARATDILLVRDAARRHMNAGSYAAELLRLEGLPDARVLAPTGLCAGPPWRPGTRVLVADAPLTAREAGALCERVAEGHLLAAFLPGAALLGALGLEPTWSTRLGGRLRVRLDGWRDLSLRFHGPLLGARPPADAEVIADDDAGAPAIVRLALGRGQALLFLYDLPRSVALSRQGDPARLDGSANRVWPGWRAADLFVDHQDLDLARVPHADLQCHLLRHLLAAWPASDDSAPPLPWLWYFPGDADTVLVLTSDDDWSTRDQFEELIACARAADATITFYLVADTQVTPADRERWTAAGHTFSIHPAIEEPAARTWRSSVRRHRRSFEARFGAPPGPSIRLHAVPWVGYARAAEWDLAAGFRWDASFFTCPPCTRHYMTASGLPCPFITEMGRVVPAFQQPAQYSDETTLGAGGMPFTLGLTAPRAAAIVTADVAANAQRHHSALCVNMHPVSFADYSRALWEPVLADAAARGAPRMALEHWAAFWESRRAVRISPAERMPNGWTWRVSAPPSAVKHRMMLAGRHAGAPLQELAWDGVSAVATRRVVHDVEHLSVPVPGGEHTLMAAYDWR